MSALKNRKCLFLEGVFSSGFLLFFEGFVCLFVLFPDYIFNYQYSLVFHLPQKLLFLAYVLFRHSNYFFVDTKLALWDRQTEIPDSFYSCFLLWGGLYQPGSSPAQSRGTGCCSLHSSKYSCCKQLVR